MPEERPGGEEPTRRLAFDFDGGDGAAGDTSGVPSPAQDATTEPFREAYALPAADGPRETPSFPAPEDEAAPSRERRLPTRRRRAAMGAACLLVAGVIAVGVGAAVGQNAAGSGNGGQAGSIETPADDRGDDEPGSDDQGASEVADDVGDEVTESTQAASEDVETLPSAKGDEKTGGDGESGSSGGSDDSSGPKKEAADCDHSWEPYGVTTKVTKAKTHKEAVPAETEVVTEYHTVCNDCKETIDGHAAEHLEETGHGGYTTNVPRKVTKVTRKATTRTVVDTPAMKVSTWHQKRCSKCGEVKDLKRAKTKAEPAKGSK